LFNTQKFGGYIALLRKKADMTQSELADRLNITRQAVSKYELGDSFPDVSFLVSIADVFGVTLDELIAAGDPTLGESKVLGDLARGSETLADSMDDVLNLAPLLRPSTLEKISSKLAVHGVDISKVVELSQYLNDSGTSAMIQNASFESLDGEAEKDLMKHLIPLLDEKSKTALFGKIIEGELDWRNLEMMMPYITYLDQQIEAAYVEGALPGEVMTWLNKALADEQEKRQAEIRAAMGSN
jgi:transcriptional regulator with XRE-family HTH domain